jgi:hypothetical protein
MCGKGRIPSFEVPMGWILYRYDFFERVGKRDVPLGLAGLRWKVD